MNGASAGLSGVSRGQALVCGVSIVVLTAYVLLFFVTPEAWFGGSVARAIHEVRAPVYLAPERLLDFQQWRPEQKHLVRHGMYLLLLGIVVPWTLMALFGRGGPRDIGFRRPNVFGWRMLMVGYVGALPFLIWMARGSTLADYYVRQLEEAGWAVFVGYYVANMAGEHVFFHGIVLAAARPGGRWPAPAPVHCSACRGAIRFLRWLGLAQPTEGAVGRARVVRWLGLPAYCVPAILCSGLLFGAIHLGKDPREFLLSVPGGVALAFVAYRTNTCLIPFALHLLTAGTTLLAVLMGE